MSRCAICNTSETISWVFGVDSSPFHLCKKCYDRFSEPIQLGVVSVFPYIAGLNPEKTSSEIQDSDEFQCRVCGNIDDLTNLSMLYLKDNYEICDFCTEKLELVIGGILNVLRGARESELKWMNSTK